KDGTDFDLLGWDITCTEVSPNLCNYDAISMTASSSKVTNSSGFESVMSGHFNTDIDCDGQSSSIVENIAFADGIIAIKDCQTIRNNAIRPSADSFLGANDGIVTSGVSNSDSISDNFVEGRTAPIWSTSSLSLDVLRNVIKGTGVAAIAVS